MSSKSKSSDSSNKNNLSDSVWKRALSSNAEWPDKVSFNITRLINEIG